MARLTTRTYIQPILTRRPSGSSRAGVIHRSRLRASTASGLSRARPYSICNRAAEVFEPPESAIRRNSAITDPTVEVNEWMNEIAIMMSKMTSHCAGTVQEESESGMRKWEEMWFKTTAEDGERGRAAVTCDGSLFHRRATATGIWNALWPTVDRRVAHDILAYTRHRACTERRSLLVSIKYYNKKLNCCQQVGRIFSNSPCVKSSEWV